MPAHRLRPGPEWNFPCLSRPMLIEPGKDRFRLGPLGHMRTGHIGEAVGIAQNHTAGSRAIPQADLSLDADILSPFLGQDRFHMPCERLAAR